jgi:F-box/leucine-rich repeat protein 2/20
MTTTNNTLAALPSDLLRHALSFSMDTAGHVARVRRVCKGWSRALASDALHEHGGLEAVCFSAMRGFRRNRCEAVLSCVLGLRTRILHVEVDRLDVDVLRVASDQCPQLSELRVCGMKTAFQLAPRWPLLTRVVFERCRQLTDDSIVALARTSAGLTQLSVIGCSKLTDASLVDVARRCPGLTGLNVSWCSMLTDVSIVEVVRGCPGLTVLNVSRCSQLTDVSIVEVARGCPGLTQLVVDGCSKLTDASIVEVARGCPGLTQLYVWGCSELTDASIVEVARGCPGLRSLTVTGCSKLTASGKATFNCQLPNCVIHDY